MSGLQGGEQLLLAPYYAWSLGKALKTLESCGRSNRQRKEGTMGEKMLRAVTVVFSIVSLIMAASSLLGLVASLPHPTARTS